MDAKTDHDLLEITGDVVSSYLSHNAVGAEKIPEIIQSVSAALRGVENEQTPQPPQKAVPPQGVNPKRSVFPSYIICLEDGKKLKMLKRHLATTYNLTPDAYRMKWGLPSDYPMVAPDYAAQRSKLAKEFGLGRPKKAAPKRKKATSKEKPTPATSQN